MKQRKPSAEAERRWRAEEAHYRRRFAAVGVTIAATILSTWICAKLEMRLLAVISVVIVFAAMIWTIRLIVGSRRAFFKIMMDDGMTRKEAAWEDLRRHGG
jgi:hypothetical protein